MEIFPFPQEMFCLLIAVTLKGSQKLYSNTHTSVVLQVFLVTSRTELNCSWHYISYQVTDLQKVKISHGLICLAGEAYVQSSSHSTLMTTPTHKHTHVHAHTHTHPALPSVLPSHSPDSQCPQTQDTPPVVPLDNFSMFQKQVFKLHVTSLLL